MLLYTYTSKYCSMCNDDGIKNIRYIPTSGGLIDL